MEKDKTLVNTPYFDWIESNCDIYNYNSEYKYNIGDQVIVNSGIYESLMDDNQGNNPLISSAWHKIL